MFILRLFHPASGDRRALVAERDVIDGGAAVALPLHVLAVRGRSVVTRWLRLSSAAAFRHRRRPCGDVTAAGVR